MPNQLAYLMLLVWPMVVFVLYRRMAPDKALIWAILGGYLLLPPLANFDLPVVPNLDKASIPNLSALVMVLFVLRDRVGLLPQSLFGKGMLLLFMLGPFATVLTNTAPIYLVAGVVPEMRIYDSIAIIANQFIALLPFFLARQYLSSAGSMRNIAVALVISAMVYSIPMLIEVRLSPQINVWVYGFFQHDFLQMIRFGGFRPIVFLQHGLWVAFFVVMALLSAMALLRAGPAADRPKYTVAVLYLGVLLVLCKSAGPLVYALGLAPAILLGGKRGILLLAALLAIVTVTYPLLRGAHLIPIDSVLALAESASPERAQSLRFRFDNEEMLLAHASEKPFFGWGGYGRNQVFDPVYGHMLTISDGMWVISMGTFGWLGYIAQFGLLALPLLALGREAWRGASETFSLYVCLVALMLGANMFDLLPNATLIPFTWLMAGALLGHVEARIAARQGQVTGAAPERRTRTIL